MIALLTLKSKFTEQTQCKLTYISQHTDHLLNHKTLSKPSTTNEIKTIYILNHDSLNLIYK